MIDLRPQALGVVLLAGALCGCSAATRSSQEAAVQAPTQRLQTLIALDRRVTEVAFNLALANVELCPSPAPKAGWLLHSASQYSGDLRHEAERLLGLDGALPGVSVVVDGSPAAVAGLQVGDLITAVDDMPMQAARDQTRAGYDDLARNLETLDAAMADGEPVRLTVQRQGTTLTTVLTPVLACPYETQVDSSPDIRARADGRRVFISSAFAAYAETPDALAFVLSHELAHNILGHPAQIRGMNLAPWRIEQSENVADRVGLFLMARAGYDVGTVPAFLRRLAQDHWQLRYPQWGHASAPARAQALEAVVIEIESLRAADRPLTP
ncbi:PDZ domain-containing protein [Brevundimonas vitis]|uniref:PDZ domain-containing protein n=1 Tax=Brevundimonas vitisensis TaxID=2800818 RepID=A0ABX7BN88_9CAUL|nr:PDZ domain-containing protein [Brevundimonas vitisensis]QQQ18208.1 PDZ domain-containing protein [Brevundimonas vitisensis]